MITEEQILNLKLGDIIATYNGNEEFEIMDIRDMRIYIRVLKHSLQSLQGLILSAHKPSFMQRGDLFLKIELKDSEIQALDE